VLCILYVEDNEDNGYMLKMRLNLTDEFEVLVAENGEKGCEIAAERPDLILMDLVRRQVAIAAPITSALVAKAATTTIPIVFVAGEDPVTATRTCPKRLGSPCSSIRPIPRPPRPQQETCKLLSAGSGRKFEVLDASTSREIDGAFATAFFSRTPRRILRGRRPAFRTPAITI